MGENPREFHIWSLKNEGGGRNSEKNKDSLMVQNSGEKKCFQEWYVNSIEYSSCEVLCR